MKVQGTRRDGQFLQDPLETENKPHISKVQSEAETASLTKEGGSDCYPTRELGNDLSSVSISAQEKDK